MEVERRQKTSRSWKGGERLRDTRELPAYRAFSNCYLFYSIFYFNVLKSKGLNQSAKGMNHGLRLSFHILAYLTELFPRQDYVAGIDLSQRRGERNLVESTLVQACRTTLPGGLKWFNRTPAALILMHICKFSRFEAGSKLFTKVSFQSAYHHVFGR